VAFLGAAEVDEAGNVNVSNFGEGLAPGCGGFIDISQTAKKVVFLGTLVGGRTGVTVRGGKLIIHRQGGEVRQR
jgi:propionate CoA-transferase